MIMITSKGPLPGDFGRFWLQKKAGKKTSVFFNENLFPPPRHSGGNVQLIDDPNRLGG